MNCKDVIDEVERKLHDKYVADYSGKYVFVYFDGHEFEFVVSVSEKRESMRHPDITLRACLSFDEALELLGMEIILQRKES